MVGTIIRHFGSEELKHDVLTRVAAGEALCSLGFSEASAGSDVFAARTRATREADGWCIEGQKMFTSGADFTDYVLLLARTDPQAPKHRGLTMFIVPLKSRASRSSPSIHSRTSAPTSPITIACGFRTAIAWVKSTRA